MIRRSLPADPLCRRLTGGAGLTAPEASAQRTRYGSNDIVEVSANPWWRLLRDTARDPMIWFLVGTSLLYAVLGELAETFTLLAAIVPLAGMDAVLHRRTQASTAGLRTHLAVRATAVRDGATMTLGTEELVPGDLVVVEAGDSFPADGVIVEGGELKVDESVLTGESFPVRKHPLTAPPSDRLEAPIDAEHWGLAGTRLLTGRALQRIAFTGGETLYGEIVRSARSSARERTPLQSAIATLVTVLLAAAVVVCMILALVRIQQGYGWIDALVSALTLAVAALPEEFPVVFTFFLGVGVYRLAKRQALVRRAVSVENIGRVSCICSDKTGTITEGRLHLTHRVPAEGVSERRLLELTAIASRPETSDPLDTAILQSAIGAGIVATSAEELERMPFTEATRRETAVVRMPGADGGVLAVTKGAAEVILGMTHLDESGRRQWGERVAALAAEGHKVIACAWQRLDSARWSGGEPQHGYRFAGLLAFEDPVREGVAEAIGRCRTAGIQTIMVTGDHPLTARAVAVAIGLGGGAPRVLTAEEMEQSLAGRTGIDIGAVDAIARAVPSQKLALVRALQRRGEIVAVTGDGVNDVPALQAADIGVAMGERGTRSAREAASIVLLDDNFRTIVRAIAEGRQLFRNLQLSFAYLLMIHIPLVTTAALIPLAGYPVLYLPIHIIWLELIIHPTALLVFQDLPDTEQLAPLPRRRTASFFARADWTRIILAGVLLTVLIVAGYEHSLGADRNVAHARAMALAVLTIASAVLTAALSRLRTWTARTVVIATAALSVLLIQIPTLARLLHLQPLHLDDWVAAVGGALLVGVPVLLRIRRGEPALT